MSGETGVDVDEDLALAVGLCALGAASPAEAAAIAGVTRWELEVAIERAGLAEPLGLDEEGDVAAEIDELLDGDS